MLDLNETQFPSGDKIDRRTLLKLAGSSLVYLVGAKVSFGAALAEGAVARFAASPARRLADELPPLDGVFLFDPVACREIAVDFGHFVHKIPLGILKPASALDIQKIVAYANRNRIPVVMRGTGGAAYGQTQVEQGIVIDSSSLQSIAWAEEDVLALEPGVIWKDAVDFAIQKGKVPAVLPDTMVISVGGTLNTGGYGETTYRHGFQVDHVVDLEVVTGAGELLTCSATQNPELFASVLGGMGQVALITRAKFRVMDAPAKVYSREFKYAGADVQTYLEDCFRFAELEPRGAISVHLNRAADGKTFNAVLTTHDWSSVDRAQPPAWLGQMRGQTDGTVKERSYHQYAHRNTQSWQDGVQNGSAALPHPYLSWFTPYEHAREILEYVLQSPSANLGAAKIVLFPTIHAHATRPFPAMPAGERSAHLRIYRIVRNGEGGADHLKMLDSNLTELLPLIQRRGGTVYLPFCPLLDEAQRLRQFGAERLSAFAGAKRAYDPNAILTPGAGLF